METVRDWLNQVWSTFRSAGIADDLTIIEHIARLLLAESRLELPKDEAMPRLPPDYLNKENIKIIKEQLRIAANQVGGLAVLFDRHILFRLPTMLPGGRYPTPRYIAKFMLELAQVESIHSMADFTCGSGGLLVYRKATDPNQPGQTFGIDISPEWAWLATANLRLHKIPSAQIENGNALKVLGEEAFAFKTFERILMNLPFGEKIDIELAARIFKKKISSRSETVLTALALQKLAPDGKAALLVPSGLLFSNSKADQDLRTQLVDGNKLEAVIALPRDAFQPYSPLQTNLLLFSKSNPVEGHLSWFFQVEQDGYPTGRGRDLTQDPSLHSDLPFVEQVWAKYNSEFDERFPNDDTNPQIGVKWITSPSNSQMGIICQGIASSLTNIKFMLPDPQTGQRSRFLMVELAATSSEKRITVQIPLETEQTSTNEGQSAEEETEQDIDSEQLPKEGSEQEINPVIPLLSCSVSAVAIAFPNHHQTIGIDKPRLLGVAVPSTTIQNQAYDLRPERYVGTQIESSSLQSPSTILARIHRNQQLLAQRIDSLFGRLELPPVATQKLPSPIFEPEFKLLEKLNPEQTKIWNKVREKTEQITDNERDNYETAAHFTLEDLNAANTEDVADATRQTIDLLERMGVIVPVTIADPKTNDPIFFYRRVTERDLWQFDSGGSNLGEKSR